MLDVDEINQWNASEFAIFLEDKNPQGFHFLQEFFSL